MIARTNSRCSSKPPRTSQLRYPSPRAPKKSIRRSHLQKARRAIACTCLCVSLSASQEIEYRTLPELIDAGSQALVRGDFHHAAHAFNSIRHNYATEPIWLEGELPAKILPLAGFASHKANLQSEAIVALESYLENYAAEQDSQIFARYTLASSLLLNEQTAEARQTFAELRKLAGNSPFRDLASLREAQLSEPSRAIEILQEVVAAPNSQRLATYARLRLIQLQLESENVEDARIHLLNTTWPETSMPELATLTFLATQVADQLIDENPSEALEAYRLVSPKGLLIDAQERRINQLQERYRNLAPALRTEQSMWSEQFRQSIQQLQFQLETLRESPDYGPAIDLRKARCFARLNRPLEAWILLQPIAISQNPLAREAHLEWISNARSMRAWNQAARIAQSFLNAYPEDQDIPKILLWIALSQIEQENYSEAIQTLQALVEREPAPDIAAAAHYYQGYCYFRLKDSLLAIAAFQECQGAAPDTPVAQQALIWTGICHFTTNQLEKAIASFVAIKQNPLARFLHPEALFREATCYFALGELERAYTLSETWLENYKLHPREADLYFLQGDILSEQNKVDAAIAAYAAVETDDAELEFLALEKRCELLLYTNRNEQARRLLTAYRSKQAVSPLHIGAYTQLLAQCLPIHVAQEELAKAVNNYGNDPQAKGIVELIHQLESPPELPEAPSPLASRILVAAIHAHRAAGEQTPAKLKALQLASRFKIEDLPPEALAEAGFALNEIESLEAPPYFFRILQTYPESYYTSKALLGLAQHHSNRSSYQEALAYLLQVPVDDIDTLSLKLDLETKLEQHLNAEKTASAILSDPQAKPSHKAKALQALGHVAQQNGRNQEAYAYYQRIFTLYRGETDQVAEAYLKCIQILESDKRFEDAQQVASEFLAQNDMQKHPSYQEVQDRFERTAVELPATAKPAAL
ncbi:tetratricopeptide repeat protein [Pelagicoccus enzymogenes]|uniref:tetratricopeptide repeat protein n=1 Tax=Pelagicoccus enzymogenes TaxID=2773457 RepID=UPI00280E0C66|nr:tetratricopeptide repeat protein [Pelagicoccus enzymogenes]MDQ8200910.1 tetratricopeptide repeat protein [Pelagicoccus enzymogenes]